jgi:hypothetical protein
MSKLRAIPGAPGGQRPLHSTQRTGRHRIGRRATRGGRAHRHGVRLPGVLAARPPRDRDRLHRAKGRTPDMALSDLSSDPRLVPHTRYATWLLHSLWLMSGLILGYSGPLIFRFRALSPSDPAARERAVAEAISLRVRPLVARLLQVVARQAALFLLIQADLPCLNSAAPGLRTGARRSSRARQWRSSRR